ncbi:hypothetical protein ACV56Z_08140 [Staphylococcus aureus]
MLKPLFQHFKEKYPEVISKIDDVVLGNVVGNGGNIARKALLEAGLKDSIPQHSDTIGNVGLDLKVFNMHVA